MVLTSCTSDSDRDITALEESEMVSRGGGTPGDRELPHLHDVGGSGDFDSLSTNEDERGDSEGLCSEHIGSGLGFWARGCCEECINECDV